MADKTTTMDIEKKEQIMVKSRGTFDSREWRINDDEVKALPDNWRDMPSIIIGMKGNNPFLTIISDSQRKDLAEFIENYDPTDKSNAVTKFYNNTSVSKRKFIIRALAREKGRPLTEHDLKNIDWNKEKERIMNMTIATVKIGTKDSAEEDKDIEVKVEDVVDESLKGPIDESGEGVTPLSEQDNSKPELKPGESIDDLVSDEKPILVDSLDKKDAKNLLNQNSNTIISNLKQTQLTKKDLKLLKKTEEKRGNKTRKRVINFIEKLMGE